MSFTRDSVPLGLLAIEGYAGGDINELAKRLAGEISIDEATGLRVVPVATALRLRRELEAEVERKRAERAEHQRRIEEIRQNSTPHVPTGVSSAAPSAPTGLVGPFPTYDPPCNLFPA